MRKANWHTFQILTKRSERLRELLSGRLKFAASLQHIWWGVSVENRRHGLPRIRHLQQSLASVRFLSIEPLLESTGRLSLDGISWVIVGGESGAGARSMARECVIEVRDQCLAAKVPFFFKQWDGTRKSLTGRELDGRIYDDFPFRTVAPVAEKSRRTEMIDEIESQYLVGVSK